MPLNLGFTEQAHLWILISLILLLSAEILLASLRKSLKLGFIALESTILHFAPVHCFYLFVCPYSHLERSIL